MPPVSPLFQPSLAARLFLSAALVLAAAITVAVLAVQAIGLGRAEMAMGQALERAGSLQATLQARRLEQLRLVVDLLVSDPYLTAYIAEAGQTGDSLSILDLLEERQANFGYDFAIALDPQGRVLARTDAPDEAGQDLSAEPLVRSALERFEGFGVLAQKGRLYHAAAVPLTADRLLVGFLIAGLAIDNAAAAELRQVTGADVVLLMFGAERPAVVATTLESATTEALLDAIQPRLAAGSAPPTAGGPSEPFEVEIDGRGWLARLDPLAGVDGRPVGTAATLASLEQEWAPYRRAGWTVAGVGLAVLLVAGAALWAVARRALGPLADLAAAARAAAAGDYDRASAGWSASAGSPASRRGDEVGDLAAALGSLLSELREKRDMEAYLAALARQVPEAAPIAAAIAEAAPPDGTTAPHGVAAAPRLPAGALAAGSVLGERFELLEVLGQGGMGLVYKARDRQLGELVALKTLNPAAQGEPGWLERLKDELRLARRVTHPNVLRTFDFGEVDGVPFITMEYVPGITLRRMLESSERLPYAAGLHLARQLCRGLAAAHAGGVLHRDIKPENILIDPSGNARIMDFGIARPAWGGREGRTERGVLVGTPDYLAPEQLAGGVVDERADLYALGVVLYAIFTARRPHRGGDVRARLVARLHFDAEPPRAAWPEIPARLEEILVRCLEREPDRRFRSVSELAAALESLRG